MAVYQFSFHYLAPSLSSIHHSHLQLVNFWQTQMMELSSAQHREMATDSLENMLICTKAQQERKPRPQQEQALKCPRCDSTNTKFCYYNNYSLTQPRYFCKSCRRYWTNGGTLRNVPVGGGCRKNKRPSSSKRSANPSSDTHHLHQPQHHLLNSSLLDSTIHHHNLPLSAAFSSQMMMSSYDDQYPPPCNDLSLVFARLQKQTSGYHDYDHAHEQQQVLGNYTNNNNFGSVNNNSGHGFLEGLKSNLLEQNNTSNFHNLYHGFGSNNSTSISNISGDQMMIPYEDLSNNSSFVTKNAALKQEDQIHNISSSMTTPDHRLFNWGAAGFPWPQLNHNNIIVGHEDSINSIINNNNMVGNDDLVRENMNVFAAPPVWHGLINSPLM